jgi:two-component system sensor histidine kinase PilS (NtrC family)
MTDEKQKLRVQWLIVFRTGLATLLLIFPFILQPNRLLGIESMTGFYGLIGATYFFNAVWLVLLLRKRWVFPGIQMVIDGAIETGLIGITGGIGSPLIFLYVLSIVAAASFFQRKGTLWMAAYATLSIVIMAVFSHLESALASQPGSMPAQDGDVLFMTTLYALSFFSVGLLSGRISENLKAQETGLVDLHFFHQNVVQSIASGLMTADLSGRVTSFNRYAALMTGVAEKAAIGRPWWEIFSWEETRKWHDDLLQKWVPQRFQGELQAPGDERRLFGMTLSGLWDQRGKPMGVIGIFQDLTQIRRLEEEMEKRRQLAMIGEMAANMAHEIRNPLASLSGSIQLLKRDLAVKDDHAVLMQIAIDESERLNGLVSQFLQYARPAPLRRQPTDLHALLADVAALLSKDPQYDGRTRIRLLTDPEPMVADVDADKIRQMIWNLYMNGLQSMPDGGDLSVSTRYVSDGRGEMGAELALAPKVEIRFQDAGVGIRDEDLPNIFKPFFTTKSSGSGLGLAIVAHIVEEHGGSIHVESGSRGTLFSVRLPVGGEILKSPNRMEQPAQDSVLLSRETAAALAYT